MEAVLNTSIDRGLSFVNTVIGANVTVTKNSIQVIGPNMLAIAAEKAAGATVRASQTIPYPDRYTAIFQHEDVTVDKLPGVDAIAAGTKLWYSVDDDAFVDSLTDVDAAGDCYACATSLELSDDVNDTVRVTFDGRNTIAEAGTG